MSLGDISVFYTSPLAIGIWALVLLVLLLGPIQYILSKAFGMKFKKIIPESSE
jgi:TctA family transporter